MSETLQIFSFFVIIFSIAIHEFAHAWMADRYGDPTARYLGRLTLNPMAHIDVFTTIILPFLIGFGWAKPVPYNPYNLKGKNGEIMVAVAGVATNLLIGLVFSALIRFLVLTNILIDSNVISLFGLIVYCNLVLGVFNLVPIPPLDGAKVLFYLLPYSMHGVREMLERNWMLFLVMFFFFGFYLIKPIVYILFQIFTGMSLSVS